MIDDDVTDNLVIEHLRRMRATQTVMAEDLHDVQLRMAHIERGFGNLHAEIANWQHLMSSLNSRVNRVADGIDATATAVHRANERMARIELRLDGLGERFGSLDERVGAVEQRIDGLETTVKQGFAQLSEQLTRLAR